jgi:CheY-like chemotaxis protein
MVAGARGVKSVLVVEADADERRRVGAWLEREGYQVLVCPGPSEPDYTCVGSRVGACPLADSADLVVLDMSLESEAVVMGTAAEELLGLYLMAGHDVVVLGSHPGGAIPGQMIRLPRHPRRQDLLAAVRALVGEARPRSAS